MVSSPFLKQQILDSFKLKEYADDNFEFDENGRLFSNWVENTGGKGEIARYEGLLWKPGLVWERVKAVDCLIQVV